MKERNSQTMILYLTATKVMGVICNRNVLKTRLMKFSTKHCHLFYHRFCGDELPEDFISTGTIHNTQSAIYHPYLKMEKV